MRDRTVEAGTRRRDDSLLEPGGVSCGMGRDHDLVGGELPQRSLERSHGIGVAELAPRHDPCGPQGGDGLAQALLVGPSGERSRGGDRADDENVLCHTVRDANDGVLGGAGSRASRWR